MIIPTRIDEHKRLVDSKCFTLLNVAQQNGLSAIKYYTFTIDNYLLLANFTKLTAFLKNLTVMSKKKRSTKTILYTRINEVYFITANRCQSIYNIHVNRFVSSTGAI